MKIKLGNLILNQKALMKLAFAGLLIGIHAGVVIAARHDGKRSSVAPFIAIYVVVIPRILRSLKKDIDERKQPTQRDTHEPTNKS